MNLDQHKHKARSIRQVLFGPSSQTEEPLPFLEMTPKNARILREIHREHANLRKRRFVDGNRQLDLKIYCEKWVSM